MRPRSTAAATIALAAALLAAVSARAADDGSGLDVLLSNKPAQGQPIDAAGSGVRQGAPSHAPKAGSPQPTESSGGALPQPTESSGGDPGAGGLADPTLGKQRKLTPASAAPGAAAGSGIPLPPELAKLHYAVFDHLGAVGVAPGFGHAGSHMLAPLHPGLAMSVRFLTGDPAKPNGAGGWGTCTLVESSAENVSSPQDCSTSAYARYTWISATPGGPPVGRNCTDWQPEMRDPGAVTEYVVVPNRLQNENCAIEPHKYYYCNLAGCPGLIEGNLDGLEDITEQEANAFVEGEFCYVSGRAAGTFHNGVCTTSDGHTSVSTENWPRCTIEAQPLPDGQCMPCASGRPVSCDTVIPPYQTPLKKVASCREACRP